MRSWLVALSCFAMAAAHGSDLSAQEAPARGPAGHEAPAPVVDAPAGFIIGPEDVLSIVFWRDKEMSTQVTVRPDGKISLPLLDEVQAAGLTPAELRVHLVDHSKRFFGNPNVTVVVNQINSRKVFITGQVVKPGPYVITAPTTVLQLISMAGGLKDFADSKNIVIVRRDGSKSLAWKMGRRAVRHDVPLLRVVPKLLAGFVRNRMQRHRPAAGLGCRGALLRPAARRSR